MQRAKAHDMIRATLFQITIAAIFCLCFNLVELPYLILFSYLEFYIANVHFIKFYEILDNPNEDLNEISSKKSRSINLY